MQLFANEPQHPLLPLPTEAEVDGLVRAVGPDEAGARLKALLEDRRRRILAAERDPILSAPRPKFWRIARRFMRDESSKLLVLLGGNRSSKSYCAAYWLLETAFAITTSECGLNEGVTLLVASESQDSSRATAQKYVWTLLPENLKRLNGKRTSRVTFIHYTVKEGFSDDILVLPNGVEIKFATYNQDPDDWEGRELGLKHRRAFAWWADENMPLSWALMLERRGRYRPGWGAWTFTPIRGITAAIKHFVGEGRVCRTRRARLLPDNQILVPGLRPGRVPFIQRGSDDAVRVCYFHSDLTPFGSGGRTYGDLVKDQVEGKTRDYILAVYYGVTRDVAGRAWPKFARNAHVVDVSHLPWEGTNYLFIDPAGGRSWFFLWARVTSGKPRRLYVYRDWPDKRRHGEWAVPTTRQLGQDGRRGLDGDTGPAQRNPGWGIGRYKRMILEEETIPIRLGRDGRITEADPHRRHVANLALLQIGLEPARSWRGAGDMPECAWTQEHLAEWERRGTGTVRESVRVRFIDPRAAGQPQHTDKGQRTLVNLFAEENRTLTGELEAPAMHVRPAFSGVDRDDGIRAVGDLLDYDDEHEIVAGYNEPHLFVASCCEQVCWTLTHYTGRGAEDDGGKDPADLLRYLALTDDVRHVTGGGKLMVGGFREGVCA